MIYSYLDTLLDKWTEWNDGFLSNYTVALGNDINSILGSTGSDNPSRAIEFFRIGFLKSPLTGSESRITFENLAENMPIQTEFGYISYLINKAIIDNPYNSKLKDAFKSICAFSLLQLNTSFEEGYLSLNTIFQYLLKIYPCPEGYNEKIYFRYLSAAMFCELKHPDKEKIYFAIKNNTHVSLRIFTKKNEEMIYEFRNSNDIIQAITNKISLTNINYEKGSIFFIGNPKDETPRGIFYYSYSKFQSILKDISQIEIDNMDNNPFIQLYTNNSNINLLKIIINISNEFNINMESIMKSLKDGCLEALESLKWIDTDSNNNIKHKLSNIIYYGAPGTGKSHTIKEMLRKIPEKQRVRVTFHPEFDYTSFVGGYKPVSEKGEDGKECIQYKFVPQTFTNIYIDAWLDLQNNYYLVIEEINRGNCAEIFGDLFQLLDRKSEYDITPSTDLRIYLEKKLSGQGTEGIKNGKMKLPPNLYIYATMNTSDQSLFPMDSAFKRRWDWHYIPICYQEYYDDDKMKENLSYEFLVKLGESQYFRWIEFIELINKQIKGNRNLGMDKCIGNYFVQPDNANTNEISLDNFINKVIFYLWNDVFKDEENNVFPDDITYEDFFPINNKGLNNVIRIIENIELSLLSKN